MAGVEDLVTAFAGGDRIEQNAYAAAAKRIADAQAAQALMDQRVQEAAKVKDELRYRGMVDKQIASMLTDPTREAGSPLNERQMGSLVGLMLQAGMPLNQVTSGLDTLNQSLLRGGAYSAAAASPETFSDFNKFVYPYNMDAMPAFEQVGDLVVRNLYGNAQVDPALTEQMNRATAASDVSGQRAKDLREIQSLIDQGWTPEDARNEVYEIDTVEMNPVLGRLERITKGPGGTASFSVVPSGAPPITMPPLPEGATLAEEVGYSTGLRSGFLALIANPQSMANIPLSKRQEITIQARQHFRTAQNWLVASMVQNPKVPVAERNWINKEIDLLPKWSKDPVVAAQTMMSLFDSLTRRMSYYDQILAHPNTPRDTYEQYFEAKLNIQQFLSEMGNPHQIGKLSAKDRLGGQ